MKSFVRREQHPREATAAASSPAGFQLLSLPEEIISRVLKSLSPLDRAATEQACTNLRQLGSELMTIIMMDDKKLDELLTNESKMRHFRHICNAKLVSSIVSVSSTVNLDRLFQHQQSPLTWVSGLDLSRMSVDFSHYLPKIPAVCRHLSRLALSLDQVDTQGAGTLLSLSSLSSLKDLQLYDMRHLDNQQLQFLSGLHSLEGLLLHYPVSLTDACFEHIATLKQLRSLRMIRTYGLEGSGLKQLSGLRHLTDVHFNNCKGVTAEGLAELSSLKTLKSLRLHVGDKYGNPLLLSTPLLQLLGSSLSFLESLELNSRVQLDKPLARCFPNLTHLVFDEQFKFGYEDSKSDPFAGWTIAPTLQSLLPLPRLSSLRLAGWIHLTPDSFRAMARQTSLSLLHVSVHHSFDPACCFPLAKLKKLHLFELSTAHNDLDLTEQALRKLVPRVQSLRVRGTVHCQHECSDVCGSLDEHEQVDSKAHETGTGAGGSGGQKRRIPCFSGTDTVSITGA